jgi:hypothetical protein
LPPQQEQPIGTADRPARRGFTDTFQERDFAFVERVRLLLLFTCLLMTPPW